MFRPSVEKFSDSYYLFSNARIIEHPKEYSIIARDTYRELDRLLDDPLLKVSGAHFWPEPQHAVPADVVVVPEGTVGGDDDTVLLAKKETKADLQQQGVV